MDRLREAWAEIDLAALRRNYKKIRKLTKAEIMPIVKADAYGHGAVPVVRTLAECGAKRFGVATLSEALELRREFPELQIMILGASPLDQAGLMVSERIIPTVFRYEQAVRLSEAAAGQGVTAHCHIKVDTGMGRIGFRESEFTEVLKVAKLPQLEIDGIYTHFASSDAADLSFTKEQERKFLEFCARLEANGVKIPFRHAANSAALLAYPESHMEGVRPGIILYGLPPAPRMAQALNLEPVMSWKAKVTNLKTIDAGETVSYGCTFRAAYPTRVATIPLGYADGLRRALSNRGEVLVRGKRATIIGRVCMDQTMLEVTQIPDVQIGDVVTLLGKDGDDRIDATEMASWLDTINYEIVCEISKRIPRIYVE